MSSRQLFGTRLDFVTFARKESGASLFLLLPFRQAVHAPFFLSFLLAIINCKMSKQRLEYASNQKKKICLPIFMSTFFGAMAIKTIEQQIEICVEYFFSQLLSLVLSLHMGNVMKLLDLPNRFDFFVFFSDAALGIVTELVVFRGQALSALFLSFTTLFPEKKKM